MLVVGLGVGVGVTLGVDVEGEQGSFGPPLHTKTVIVDWLAPVYACTKLPPQKSERNAMKNETYFI